MTIDSWVTIIAATVSLIPTVIGLFLEYFRPRQTHGELYSEIVIDLDGTRRQVARNVPSRTRFWLLLFLLTISVFIFSYFGLRYLIRLMLIRGIDLFANPVLNKYLGILVWVFIAVIIFLLLIVVFWKEKFQKRKWALFVVSIITIAVVLFVSGFIVWNTFQHWTVYLLVDRSIVLDGLEDYVLEGISTSVGKLPINAEIGIGVFGSKMDGKTECENYAEILQPSTDHDKLPTAIKVIELSESDSNSPLNNAILFTVNRLRNRRGVQQIVVITSKYDTKCGELEHWQVDEQIDNPNTHLRIDIISVGDIQEKDKSLYRLYAYRYRHANDKNEFVNFLSELLKTPPSAYESVYDLYR